MTKTIYKYPLEIEGHQIVELPVGAQILTVQIQNAIPMLWALIDKDQSSTVIHGIVMFGTGHLIKDDTYLKFISTIQVECGHLVFHVFHKTI